MPEADPVTIAVRPSNLIVVLSASGLSRATSHRYSDAMIIGAKRRGRLGHYAVTKGLLDRKRQGWHGLRCGCDLAAKQAAAAKMRIVHRFGERRDGGAKKLRGRKTR